MTRYFDPGAGSAGTVLIADGQPVTVPEGTNLFTADMHRDGPDLVIEGAGGDLRIVGYFSAAPVDLVNAEGAVLRGHVVERLAGPEAPGQYAQAGGFQLPNPIGQVETLEGGASVQRADGTVEALSLGTLVYENDVVQTDDGGSLGITFVDGTIFTLASGSRMMLDELVYDPDGTENSGVFNLIEGSFVFIAGQAAKTGGMEVQTPTATMGIRGTTVKVDIQTVNGVTEVLVSLNRDPDGGVGAIELRDLDGNLIANITATDTAWVISPIDGQTREIARTESDLANDQDLLSDALAAYQLATQRFAQSGTFVTLDGGAGAIAPPPVEDVNDPPPPPPPAPDDPDGGDGDDDNDGGQGRDRIIDVNDAPVGTDYSFDLTEDAIARGTLVATDADGDTLTFSLAEGAENGLVVIQANGQFTYTPNADFEGTDRFTYTVSDGELSDTRTVTFTVIGTNDAPRIDFENSDLAGTVTDLEPQTEPETFEVAPFNFGPQLFTFDALDTPAAPEPGTASGRILASDPDAGDSLTWSASVGETTGTTLEGTYGTFTLQQDGNWTYVLDAARAAPLAQDETATDSFVVTVTDSDGTEATATVVLTVTGRNNGPEVDSETSELTGSVTETGSGAIGLLSANTVSGELAATDADSASLTWTGSASGTYGALSVTASGSWTYTLDESLADSLTQGEQVTDSFTVTVTDDFGATATETVTVTITGTNDAPVVQDITLLNGGAIDNAGFDSALDGWTTENVFRVEGGGSASNLNGGVSALTSADPTAEGDTTAARLSIGGQVSSSFSTGYGPLLVSSAFTAVDGQAISFIYELNAEGGTGSRDDGRMRVYLRDAETDEFVAELFSDSTGVGTTTGIETFNGTIANAGTYELVFEVGSFDSTGGLVVGSDLYVYSVDVEAGLTEGDSRGFAQSLFLDGATDAEGDALSLLSVSAFSANGARVSIVDGEVVYDSSTLCRDLSTGEVLTDTFTYTISDGRTSTTATATISVQGSDDVTPSIFTSDLVEFTDIETAIGSGVLDIENGNPESLRLTAADVFCLSNESPNDVLFGVLEDGIRGLKIFGDGEIPEFEIAGDDLLLIEDGNLSFVQGAEANDPQGFDTYDLVQTSGGVSEVIARLVIDEEISVAIAQANAA